MSYTIFLFALFLCAFLTGCSSPPESTVEKFYRATEAGQCEAAAGYLSADITSVFGPKKIEAMCAEQRKEILECGGIRSIQVDLKGEDNLRTGEAVMEYKGDCSPKREEVILVLEEGAWKLSAEKFR